MNSTQERQCLRKLTHEMAVGTISTVSSKYISPVAQYVLEWLNERRGPQNLGRRAMIVLLTSMVVLAFWMAHGALRPN